MSRSRRFVPVVLLAACALLPTASPRVAHAETTGGIRMGFSSTPDQFVFGGQLNLNPVGKQVYIVPSGELGVGDHVTTLCFNGDVQYRFETRSEVRPYAGGGVSLFDVTDSGDTNFGVSALGGIFFGRMNGKPMFAEAKLGLSDEVPDWKFIFGINF
ncbi:MAG: hypothetical protein ACM3PF_11965 [Bacteroidota bacterium]